MPTDRKKFMCNRCYREVLEGSPDSIGFGEVEVTVTWGDKGQHFFLRNIYMCFECREDVISKVHNSIVMQDQEEEIFGKVFNGDGSVSDLNIPPESLTHKYYVSSGKLREIITALSPWDAVLRIADVNNDEFPVDSIDADFRVSEKGFMRHHDDVYFDAVEVLTEAGWEF